MVKILAFQFLKTITSLDILQINYQLQNH